MHPFPWNVGPWALREGRRLLLVLPEPRRSKSTFYPGSLCLSSSCPALSAFPGLLAGLVGSRSSL